MPYAGEIHYRGSVSSSRERDPLILIHGAGGSYLYWPPEIRRLAGGGVLAIDLPGHGDSVGDGKESIDAYAHALLDYMEILEIDQAVLAGHSMGSAVAQRISLDYPERVRALILIGAGAKLRVYPQLIELCSREVTYPDAVTQVVKWAFSQQADQILVKLAEERMEEMPRSVLLADFKACDAFDMRDQVGEIEQPTLIICGEEDQMTPVRFSQYLEENIRGSRLELIPDAGHMVMLEKPEIVARLVADFLDEVASVRK
ncbi:MAG: alpha/beta hydrolase [Anaerolineales bacterium]